jgi:hypothetical protein
VGRDGSILAIGQFVCVLLSLTVRTTLDAALSHHGIDDLGVGLTTLAHNRLTGIESNAHDAIFCLIGEGHPQIPEGDVANAKSIVEIVPKFGVPYWMLKLPFSTKEKNDVEGSTSK